MRGSLLQGHQIGDQLVDLLWRQRLGKVVRHERAPAGRVGSARDQIGAGRQDRLANVLGGVLGPAVVDWIGQRAFRPGGYTGETRAGEVYAGRDRVTGETGGRGGVEQG